MKKKLTGILILLMVFVLFLPSIEHKAEAATTTMVSSDFEIYSNDGTVFLGTLSTNRYDSDSIFNK